MWEFGTGWGVLAVPAWISYYAQNPRNHVLFIIAIILTALSTIFFLTYLILLAKKHLLPLHILDDIRCTYWPREKQVQVLLWICNYSNSPEFNVSCLTQFGSQTINVVDRVQLDGIYIGNTYCRGGRKRMFEFFKNNVEVQDPNQCFVTISMKPLGIWKTKKKSKAVSTLVVNH